MIVQNTRPVPNAQFLVAKFTINRNYSTLYYIDNLKLDPLFVTGFTDGECCFSIRIRRSKNIKIGWLVELKYVITLHKRDKALLEQIKNLFGVGKFYKHRLTYSQFIVFK